MDPEKANSPFISMMKESLLDAARKGEASSVRPQGNSPEADAEFKKNVTEFLTSEGFTEEQIAKVLS